MINTNKLYKILLNDSTLKDVPIRHIIKVCISVMCALKECIEVEEYE